MFGNEPSIADLILGCEMTQLYSMDYPVQEKFPVVHRWFVDHMLQIQGFKKVHEEGTKKLKFVLKFTD